MSLQRQTCSSRHTRRTRARNQLRAWNSCVRNSWTQLVLHVTRSARQAHINVAGLRVAAVDALREGGEVQYTHVTAGMVLQESSAYVSRNDGMDGENNVYPIPHSIKNRLPWDAMYIVLLLAGQESLVAKAEAQLEVDMDVKVEKVMVLAELEVDGKAVVELLLLVDETFFEPVLLVVEAPGAETLLLDVES